jgi:tetratricopeptide (TPR) repeat protein
MLSKFSWQLGLIAIVTIIPIYAPSVMARKPRVVTPVPKAVNIPAGKNADDYYFESGREKYQRGDLQGALTDFNRVIELCPTCYGTFLNRGDVKLFLKDYRGALSDYNRAIESPNNSTKSLAYNNRGVVKSNESNVSNDYEGALADFQRAIKLDPQNVKAIENFANLRRQMSGENNEAKAQDIRRRMLNVPIRDGGLRPGK